MTNSKSKIAAGVGVACFLLGSALVFFAAQHGEPYQSFADQHGWIGPVVGVVAGVAWIIVESPLQRNLWLGGIIGDSAGLIDPRNVTTGLIGLALLVAAGAVAHKLDFGK